MILFIKKIGKRKYKVIGNPYLLTFTIFFILFFPIISIIIENWKYGFIWSFCGVSLLTFFVYLSDIFGKRRHKAAHQKKLFQALYGHGFELEKFGEYQGLIKSNVKGTVRIYYDWNKMLKGPMSYGDIVVNILYDPIVRDYEKYEIDKLKLKSLNKKYEIRNLKLRRYFTWNKMCLHFNYYPWSKASKILKVIDEGSEIIANESLLPINVNKLEGGLKDLHDKGWYHPMMELISDELEKRFPDLD